MSERLPQQSRIPIKREIGALYVPTAEWIDPYVGLTDEQKELMMIQVEPPTFPEQDN